MKKRTTTYKKQPAMLNLLEVKHSTHAAGL